MPCEMSLTNRSARAGSAAIADDATMAIHNPRRNLSLDNTLAPLLVDRDRNPWIVQQQRFLSSFRKRDRNSVAATARVAEDGVTLSDENMARARRPCYKIGMANRNEEGSRTWIPSPENSKKCILGDFVPQTPWDLALCATGMREKAARLGQMPEAQSDKSRMSAANNVGGRAPALHFLPILFLGLSVVAVNVSARAQTPVYQDKAQPLEARVEDLLGKLTPEEKIDTISGINGFDVRPIERLNVPKMHMSDGPCGTRNDGPTTAYPAPVGLAASWDVDLAKRFGDSIGLDARARG